MVPNMEFLLSMYVSSRESDHGLKCVEEDAKYWAALIKEKLSGRSASWRSLFIIPYIVHVMA